MFERRFLRSVDELGNLIEVF